MSKFRRNRAKLGAVATSEVSPPASSQGPTLRRSFAVLWEIEMRKTFLFLAVSILALLPFLAHGQNATGSASGTVVDPSGSPIPQLTVTLVQETTNREYPASVTLDGRYSVSLLPVGSYTIIAEAPGFKLFRAIGMRVQVNENPRLDIVLQVGDLAQSVDVIAEAVNIDTQSGTLKAVVDERRVEDLPLNGRDPLQLARIMPGVQTYQGEGVTSGTAYPGVTPISVNGSRGNAVNYMVDGAQNNDHYNNAPSPVPNPDAVAEFSVQTNNFSAEFGRSAGGVVNVVTRSGTNEFHGTAFEYLRHHKLNAGNFFAPSDPDDPSKKLSDGLKRNQFGVTAGGPVYIPKFYDGRNRTFVFGSYQGTRTRELPTTSFDQSFTAAEKAGDFSATDLDSPLLDPSANGAVFANNVIPQARLSPITRYVVDHYVPTGTPDGNRVITTSKEDFNDNQYLIKADHSITDLNTISGKFALSRAIRPGRLDADNYFNQTTESFWRNYSLSLIDTHLFGPGLLNSFTFGYNRTRAGDTPIQPEKGWADLGSNIAQDTDKQLYARIQGPMETIHTGETEVLFREEYQFVNILRWSTGRHQLSIGGEYGRGVGDNTGNFQSNGRAYFEHSAGFTGYAPADFLVGKFARFTQSLGSFKETRLQRAALFVQDSIHATSRLTLSLGLRWEPGIPFTDKADRVSVWSPGNQSTRFTGAPTGILYAGDSGVSSGGYDAEWKRFAPRISVAYDLTGDGRTSLRAGYGFFYDQPNTIMTNSASQQAPFGTTVEVFGNQTNSMANPYATFAGGNPFTVVGNSAFGTPATRPPSDFVFPATYSAFVYDRNFHNARVQSWNLTLEREVVRNLITRLAYAGSKGQSLLSGRDVNAPFASATASTSTTNQRRPLYPALGRVTLMEGVGQSIYHSFQATAEKRFGSGFSILANYTYSKTIDNNLGSANKGTGVSVTNPLDQSFDRGPADFDKTHVANLSGLWEIPFYSQNGFAKAAFGGWSLSSIVALQSGFPITVYSDQDNARTGQSGQRGDLVGDPYFGGGRDHESKLQEWLRRSAFAPNALGTYGNLGRNIFRGPGRANVDFGIHKQFPVTERTALELRIEAFNALNHANFENPSNELTDSDFMRITDAYDPRILQFALRFTW